MNRQQMLRIGAGVCIVVAVLLLFLLRQGDNEQLHEAYQSYQEGVSAKNVNERKKAFNRALDVYLGLENEYQPRYSDGKLYYNIGNTYFQLGQYSWAVLYYARAEVLMPRNEKVARSLLLAQEKLGVPSNSNEDVFAKVFFFHSYLSLPERLQVFFMFACLALFFLSAYIWNRNRWLKKSGILFLFFASVMLLSVGYSRYFAPIDGILVRSFDLKRDAGEEYMRVGHEPLQAGMKVEVLSVSPDGMWFKVLTPNGELGYVSQEALKVVGPS